MSIIQVPHSNKSHTKSSSFRYLAAVSAAGHQRALFDTQFSLGVSGHSHSVREITYSIRAQQDTSPCPRVRKYPEPNETLMNEIKYEPFIVQTGLEITIGSPTTSLNTPILRGRGGCWRERETARERGRGR